MLEKEYSQDYTTGRDIIQEFHVDETKRNYFKERILEKMASTKGIFGKFKRKTYENFLNEIDRLGSYYITDNNYLYTYEDNVKRVYDIGLCYDLKKMPNDRNKLPAGSLYYIDTGMENCWVCVNIDGSGVGSFEINEDGSEEGFSGIDAGSCMLAIWDVYEPDIYSTLLEYIKPENEVETLSSLTDIS